MVTIQTMQGKKRYRLNEFRQVYEQYLTTDVKADLKQEALESIYYFLKISEEQRPNNKIIFEQQIIHMLQETQIMELVTLWQDLMGKTYYGKIDTDLIIEVVSILEEHNALYIDYIQEGVRGNIYLVFVGWDLGDIF